MGSHVVDAVMNAGQNEMHVLQNGYVPWQAEVSMRPLVKLVSERYENSQEEQVKVPVVGILDELVGIRDEFVGNIGEDRHDNGKIVAIGFDKVVTSDGRRVDVMFAEVSQQILSNEEHLNWAVRVGCPVNNST